MPSNSLSYSNDIASNRWGHFCLLLFRIKGSIYRLIFFPLALFLCAYATTSIIYRFALNEGQRRKFENIVIYVNRFGDVAPMTIALGFYTSAVLGRWWATFSTLPWPQRVSIAVSACITPNPKAKDRHKEILETRLLKRTIARYASAACAMTLQQVTHFKNRLRREFPRLKNLQYVGLLTKEERHILENFERFDLDIYEGLHTMCCRLKEGRETSGYCLLWKVFNFCSWAVRIIACCCPFVPSCIKTDKKENKHKAKKWCACYKDPERDREIRRQKETTTQYGPDFEIVDYEPKNEPPAPNKSDLMSEPQVSVSTIGSVPGRMAQITHLPTTVLRFLGLKSKHRAETLGTTLAADVTHVDAKQEELDIENPLNYVPICCCLPCVKVNVQCCDTESKYCCAGKIMKCWKNNEEEHTEDYFYDSFRSRKVGNFYVPLVWAVELIKKAFDAGRIRKAELYEHLIKEIQDLRSSAGILKCFMWINIPLAYTQVIEWVVMFHFSVMVIGRQFLDSELYKKDPEKYSAHNFDMVFPVFTIIEFIFYMGWLKIAEGLQNPFGDDECDFDLTNLVYDNYKTALYICDEAIIDFPTGVVGEGFCVASHDADIFARLSQHNTGRSTSMPEDSVDHAADKNVNSSCNNVDDGDGPPVLQPPEENTLTSNNARPDTDNEITEKPAQETEGSHLKRSVSNQHNNNTLDCDVKRIERHMLALEKMMAELLKKQHADVSSHQMLKTIVKKLNMLQLSANKYRSTRSHSTVRTTTTTYSVFLLQCGFGYGI